MCIQKTNKKRAAETTTRPVWLRRFRGVLKRVAVFMLLLLVGLTLFFAFRPEGDFVAAAQTYDVNTSDGVSVKILTWNILRGGGDSVLDMGWEKRKDSFSEILADSDYDILCFQEVLPGQLAFFNELLGGYESIAAGRQDGQSEGEHGPIFYRAKRFKLLESGTFWLSPTPEHPSHGWGEAIPRICTWVELEDKESRGRFRVYNTHLQIHPYAQYRAAQLLAERLEALDVPVILAGDFNAPPDWPPLRVLQDAGLTRAESSGAMTYHVNGKGIRCLDQILFSSGWQVCEGSLLKDKAAGVYPSDHFGLWVKLQLSKF